MMIAARIGAGRVGGSTFRAARKPTGVSRALWTTTGRCGPNRHPHLRHPRADTGEEEEQEQEQIGVPETEEGKQERHAT